MIFSFVAYCGDRTVRVTPIVSESLCAIRRVSLSGKLFEKVLYVKKKEDTVYNIIF